ncbi:MAG: Ni/Fe hydrogenase subunit alpha [Jiangellaceae bacterium]
MLDSRTLRVDALARVEGEGAMTIEVRDERVDKVRLDIYEPPRFFEGFLRGRSYLEPPDVTARICGICPVAYQVSACNALEDALGLEVDASVRELRRLLYCGEWIQSHALHVYLLHAPDFLGYQGAVEMARDHPEAVKRGLQLKKIGNKLMEAIGGRAVHPINVRVGGFYRAPGKADLQALREPLQRALDAALETVRWVGTFEMPELVQHHPFVALHTPERYAIEDGRLVSSTGLDLPASAYETHFEELQVEHSTALHAAMDGQRYLVGPQARYTLNYGQLSDLARDAAAAAGLGPECRNPFQSIVVRSVELVYAVEEAIRLIDSYEPPAPPYLAAEPRRARGHGWSEAPRGLLYHRYDLDEDGLVEACTIVPPTSQNQSSVEDDLRRFAQAHLHLDDEELQWRCEQAIRNYDPCISCSTHFLTLNVDRKG